MALRNQFIEYDPASSRIQDLTSGFIKKLKSQSTVQPAVKTAWLTGDKRQATGYELAGGPIFIYRLTAARPDQQLLADAFSILKGLDVVAIRHKDRVWLKHEALMVCIFWLQDERASQGVIEGRSSTQRLEGAVCLGEVHHGY